EHQRGVRADQRGAATLAVGQFAGNPEPVLRTHRHQGQALGPAGDDLVQAELGRLVASKRAVELGAVEQGAAVVHADAVAGPGARTRTRLEHAVLQARAGGEHALGAAVAGEEIRTGLAVGLGLLAGAVARTLFQHRTRLRGLV